MNGPRAAIIAVTMNCNSRCIMCNIWQNRIHNELKPDVYLTLPGSLADINITGGEPFLRSDLDEIVKNMKIAAPHARLILNTNGFLPRRIGQMMEKILAIDPGFAFRVSVDGIGTAHDKIRRIPGGFAKILQTIDVVKKLGVKDIGVSFTLGNYNIDELQKVQNFCKKNSLEFSLTVATGSVIYFGKDKLSYRPTDTEKVVGVLKESAHQHLAEFSPKEIVRGWFVNRLLQYMVSGKRPLPCDAGEGFFYMDSIGNVYTCHMKPWIMGNIRKQPIGTILSNRTFSNKVHLCNDCWMICTTKTMIRKRLCKVVVESATDKLSAM